MQMVVIVFVYFLQMWFAFGALAAGGLATGYLLQPSVDAADLELHPPHLPWPHKGVFSSLDHARYMGVATYIMGWPCCFKWSSQ